MAGRRERRLVAALEACHDELARVTDSKQVAGNTSTAAMWCHVWECSYEIGLPCSSTVRG